MSTYITALISEKLTEYENFYYNDQYSESNIEMEIKFKVGTKKSQQKMTAASFYRVKRFLENYNLDMKEYIYSVDIMNDNSSSIRKLTYTKGSDSELPVWEVKNRLLSGNYNDYGMKIDISEEYGIEPVDNFEPSYSRKIHRYSFHKPLLGVIDISIVNTSEGKTFEIELEIEDEILTNVDRVKSLSQYAIKIFKLINDTDVLYSYREKQNIVSIFNKMVSNNKQSFDKAITNIYTTNARNIKYGDLVSGGLIGNDNTHYTITHKSDGLRKFIMFENETVWLISQNGFVNKLFVTDDSAMNGTIIDCEMIPYELRRTENDAPKSEYWFVIIDALVIKYENITNKNQIERLKEAEEITKGLRKNSKITITTKSFKTIESAEDLFENVIYMQDDLSVLPFYTDGFMFTPRDTNYIPTTNIKNMKLYARKLTRYADIVKWKPPQEITIDFAVYNIRGEYKLVSEKRKEKTREKVVFKGTPSYPFNSRMIRENELLQSVQNGDIVEFEFSNNMMQAKRLRLDKNRPNNYEIAIDNWEDINNPITIDVMKGKTIRLMRKYHNRVKRNLFSSLPKGNLLDIGSGKGGDISKMSNFKKIILVEPNTENLKELIKRLSKSNLSKEGILLYSKSIKVNSKNGKITSVQSSEDIQNGKQKVLILQTGGEDTSLIKNSTKAFFGELADVVTMMFSLSFFWESKENLKSLANTIRESSKNNSVFAFTTVDGKEVNNFFDVMKEAKTIDSRSSTISYSENQIKGVSKDGSDIFSLKRIGENEMEIYLPDTIVGQQKEWMVHMEDLKDLLYDFTQKSYEQMSNESLLSTPEFLLTKLYYSGVYARGSSPDKLVDKKVKMIPYIDIVLKRITIKSTAGMLDVASMIHAI